MRKSFIFISFMVFLILASMLLRTEANQRYCGKSLNDAMRTVCEIGFNAKPLKRNNLQRTNTNEFDYNSLANDIITLNMSQDSSKSLQYPPGSKYSTYKSMIYNSSMLPHALKRILSKVYNNMMLTQTRRHRRAPSPNGIHYECCLKGCSFIEMSAYCL